MCPGTDTLCLEESRRISLFRTPLLRSATNGKLLPLRHLWQKRDVKDKVNEKVDNEQRNEMILVWCEGKPEQYGA